MSVKVNYKGAEIFSADTDTTKTLQTAGKYCEDDIEIVNTQDGGDNPLLYATNVRNLFENMPQDLILPSSFTLELSSAVDSLFYLFQKARMQSASGSKITIKTNGIITEMWRTFYSIAGGAPEIIELDFDTSHITNASQCFYNCDDLKTIIGTIDFSSMTNTSYMFGYCSNLENMVWAENTLSKGDDGYFIRWSSKLTNATLISMANGLNESVTGKTLTLHATPKATCSTIMGVVAMDETNTYHIFTADESGTVSLENFITQTKGWTIA